MGSVPKPKDPVLPAKAPTRAEGVAPEDVVLGGVDNIDDSSTSKGKRALIRPTGFSNTGLNTGV